MGDFVELGCEGVNHLVDKHWDKGWAHGANLRQSSSTDPQPQNPAQDRSPSPASYRRNLDDSNNNTGPTAGAAAATSSRRRKFVNDLPPPETDGSNNNDDNDNNDNNDRVTNVSYRRTSTAGPQPCSAPPPRRDDSLERQSQASERVIRAYEGERDDPRRKPESVLSRRDLNPSTSVPQPSSSYQPPSPNNSKSNNSNRRRRSSRYREQQKSRNMSNANGYAPYDNVGRSRSQQPPPAAGGGGKYYNDDDDNYSDYDDRTGRRYSNRSGGARGYDYDYDDDRGYDREIVETERYKGPARNFPRQDSYTSRAAPGAAYDDNNPAGAMTQYRRSANDVAYANNQRSRSRGRRDKDRSYSYSRSRSRSRSSENASRGIRGKLDDHFDTSLQGLGVGLAGAVVGGLAGRQIGGRHGGQHRNRDILIGAVVGGLASNAAEHKWKDWKEEKKERLERDEAAWDRRSRSAMR